MQREEISGEKLFQDVQRQMIAWSQTVEPEETIAHFRGGVDGAAGEGPAERVAQGAVEGSVAEVAAEEAPGAAEGGAEADAWLGVPDLGGASATTQERKAAGSANLKMFTAVVGRPVRAGLAKEPDVRGLNPAPGTEEIRVFR